LAKHFPFADTLEHEILKAVNINYGVKYDRISSIYQEHSHLEGMEMQREQVALKLSRPH
jgi:hypothetical protein